MKDQCVIYRVHLSVKEALAGDYENWLKSHISEMLNLPGFRGATMTQCEGLDSEEQAGYREWVVDYTLNSREDLERYFTEYSAKMRGDGLKRFEGQFTVRRWILSQNQEYTA